MPRTRHLIRYAHIWGSWVLLLILGLMLWSAPAGGQDLEFRIKAQEDVKAATRLTAIETRLDSIEWLGKSILVAVVGQLVLNGLNLRRKAGGG